MHANSPPKTSRIVIASILLCVSTTLLVSQDAEAIATIRAKASQLIKQLGSDNYALRKEAQEQLSEYAPLIRQELLDAIESDDLEIAARARAILAKTVDPNFRVLDALGEPIPFAKIDLHGSGTKRYMSAPAPFGRSDKVEKYESIDQKIFADAKGGIVVKDFDAGSVEISIDHPDYGRGRAVIQFPIRAKAVRFPLVEKSSKAAGRALTGIVKDAKGKAVSGALIHGFTIRTSGEGLINAIPHSADGLTNAKGEFRFYLPNQPNSTRGKLIPLNSNYRIQVSMPGDSENIPISGRFNNQKNAQIVFSLGDRIHKFAFETLDGKPPSKKHLNDRYFISYHGTNLRNLGSRLDINQATKGMKLKKGIYRASILLGVKSVEMQPIQVNESSRENLIFRLPPKIEYRGRVIDGVTREPMPNSIVISYDSQGKGSLAALTDEEWDTLSSLAADKILTDPLMNRLRKVYGIQAITKTNAKGEFTITQPPGGQAYGLIAFDKNYVPYSMANNHLLPKQNDPFETKTLVKSLIKDFPLFPAAKVLVTPSIDAKALSKKRVSVMPVWMIDSANQPKWVKDYFDKASHYSRGDFQYDQWLAHNERQAVFVPAGLSLQLKFATPYDEFVSPAVYGKPINLEQGEVLDIGEIDFRPALRAVVKVTDKKGNPVEGLPIRKMEQGTNAWSIVHNTNASGEAIFGMNRNSKGKFRVGERSKGIEFRPVLLDFKVKDMDPNRPFTIELSADQIRMIRSSKSPIR